MHHRIRSFAVFVTLSTSCATIVSDSNCPVMIDSSPSNFAFVVRDADGEEIHSGVTPTTVELAASAGFFDSAEYTVTFERAGFPPQTTELFAALDPWYWGNILFGGLIGLLIVDPASGSMWKLEKRLVADLQAATGDSSVGHLQRRGSSDPRAARRHLRGELQDVRADPE